jgi:hypothetical protein
VLVRNLGMVVLDACKGPLTPAVKSPVTGSFMNKDLVVMPAGGEMTSQLQVVVVNRLFTSTACGSHVVAGFCEGPCFGPSSKKQDAQCNCFFVRELSWHLTRSDCGGVLCMKCNGW